MAKVYGICGDNKYKREVNAIYKKVTIPEGSSSATQFSTTIRDIKDGLYLVVGTLSIVGMKDARVTVRMYNAASAYEPEINRNACSYYINDDGTMLNAMNINYCKVIDVMSEDNGVLDFMVSSKSSFNIGESDLYFIKLK